MKIPKYISEIIEKRAETAERYNHYDYQLSKWLDKKGIITESCDTHGGVESIVNPWSSADRVRDAIINTKEKGAI